jgi:hypothetical protein
MKLVVFIQNLGISKSGTIQAMTKTTGYTTSCTLNTIGKSKIGVDFLTFSQTIIRKRLSLLSLAKNLE